MASHAVLPFRAVVVDGDNRNGVQVGINSIQDDEEPWMVRSSGRMTRSVQNIVSVCSPLLHGAKRVAIVDPWIDLSTRGSGRDPLQAILREVWTGRETYEVALHASTVQGTWDHWHRVHSVTISSMLPADRSISVYVWQKPDERRDDRLHDRLLLADQGGIYIGWGFNADPKKTTQVSTIDAVNAQDWFDALDPKNEAYELAGPPIECGFPTVQKRDVH